jgi:endo-1,4-beta-xylanase
VSVHRFVFPLLLAVGGAVAQAQPALKDVFRDAFKIGAAINAGHFTGKDARGVALIQKHCNAITPENHLKWSLVHPAPGRYEFGPADAYVAFGERNKMFIVGHTLVWHSQVPAWVFEDEKGAPLTRDALLARMQDHIATVVGRYKGRIHGWDVVNEALNDDGTLRQTQWLKIIGEDYLVKAFQFAHAADPQAELYYNDFSLEIPAKRDAAVVLVKKLRAAGVRVSGIGTQNHHKLGSPSLENLDDSLAAFEQLGLKIHVTELDVDVLPAKLNPYTEGLPEEVHQALAKRYAGLFTTYLLHRKSIARVTFWGVSDNVSWLNNFPTRGRTNHPLLFDREGNPKPAFDAVIGAGRAAGLR